MKIGVVGCGAVGSYYGGRLATAGHETHFLLRSDYETVRRTGLRVLSADGGFQASPVCAKLPEEIGHCDLLLIGLKTTANAEFPNLLPPLVGPHTAIVTLQNGLGNEERLAELFAPEQILGGLCFVCLNRLEPGVVHHIAHGLVMLGEFARPAGLRVKELAERFRAAGIPCEVTDNLARAHWEKLVWNIPFNGLGVAAAAGHEAFEATLVAPGASVPELHNRATGRPGPCWPTDRLLSDPRWEALVRELMLEVIGAAGALGLKIPESLADKQLARTRTMGAYKASTLLDFECGRPLEMQTLFLEPLRQAQAAGCSTPRLERLCAVLQALERRAR